MMSGRAAFSLCRRSARTSSVDRSRFGFSFSRKSPLLGSVMKSPSWAPVRREKLSSSGVGQDDVLGVLELAVRLGQAGARRRQVVDDESALVHGRQEFAFQLAGEEDAQDQDDDTGGDRPAAPPQGGPDDGFVDAR